MRITLPHKQTRKLLAEAAGSRIIFHQLCRESITRQWLAFCGIPSWRNPGTPSEELFQPSYTNSRYSIMLADGTRFLVCPFPHPVLWLDLLAAAKCFAALAVELEENSEAGSVRGCIFLPGISVSPRINDFTDKGLESCSVFLHCLKRPFNYSFSLVKFSTRLLLFGEPQAPERGTEEANVFYPV
jgi:hypothetical protein